jgi:transposase-like protein
MAKNEILEAVLKDGKLYCPSCGSPLGNVSDYYEVDVNGERFTLFQRYCSKSKCRTQSHYELKLTLDSREIKAFPLSECKKIKEEKKVFKEDE